MKILSLLKAVLSEDMNMFKYKSKSKGIFRLVLPIVLFIIVSFSFGSGIYYLSEELAKYHLTYISLSLIFIVTSFITLFEGILKSQSILFDCKDNDILFSLPIKKSTILFIRIIKLLLFEYIFNLMILLPTYVVYIILEMPGIEFYLLSIIFYILIPIIPTIVACFIGYIIKIISSKMKYKSIIQTILTMVPVLLILFISMNSENVMNSIVKNATNINDLITKVYYPVGLCISLMTKFKLIDLIILLLINILPFIIFIMIGQLFYFKIISNNRNNRISIKFNNNIKIKQNRKIVSLTKKEIKRYLKSPVLIFNTSFGLIILLIFTVILCFRGKSSLIGLLSNYGISENISTDVLYYGIIIFSLSMTSITSSSISLEGKTINITKSLPIDYKLIFISKILNCFIIELPFALISIILYMIFFKILIVFFIQLIIISILIILVNSIIGLMINLKYPKLKYNNDTEVVKQSMSSLISVAIGFSIFIIIILSLIILYNEYIILIHIVILLLVNIILYKLLTKKGPKVYKKLNV